VTLDGIVSQNARGNQPSQQNHAGNGFFHVPAMVTDSGVESRNSQVGSSRQSKV
jgi:hypothetical protein